MSPYVDGVETIPCPKCGGEGIVSDHCRECGNDYNERECEECKGSGEVPVNVQPKPKRKGGG